MTPSPLPVAWASGAAVFPWQRADESLVREARLKPAPATETAHAMTTSLSRWLRGVPAKARHGRMTTAT